MTPRAGQPAGEFGEDAVAGADDHALEASVKVVEADHLAQCPVGSVGAGADQKLDSGQGQADGDHGAVVDGGDVLVHAAGGDPLAVMAHHGLHVSGGGARGTHQVLHVQQVDGPTLR